MLGSSRAKAGDARSLPGRIIGLAGVIALACLSALPTSASAQRDSRDQVPGLALVVPAGSHLSLQNKAFEHGLFWGAPVAAFPKSATGVTVVSKTGGASTLRLRPCPNPLTMTGSCVPCSIPV